VRETDSEIHRQREREKITDAHLRVDHSYPARRPLKRKSSLSLSESRKKGLLPPPHSDHLAGGTLVILEHAAGSVSNSAGVREVVATPATPHSEFQS